MARYCRLGAVLAALMLVCALAPGASAVVVHSRAGQFLGVTLHQGASPAAIAGSVARTAAAPASPAAATAQPYENLNYQGGPVLHSSAPYVIFWAPAGESIPADWQSLIGRYFTDVAADSTRASNVYAVDRQFTDQAGFADYRQSFNPATQVIADTDAYPTPRDATNCGASSYATCLTDGQLQSQISAVIAAHGLPTDGSTASTEFPDAAPIYFVVLPTDVDVCFSDGSGTCASNNFCAYHSAYADGTNNVLYATIPTLALDNATDAKSCQYDGNPAVQEPNGSLGDVALKYIGHEDSETITDPLGTGWWSDYTGNEDGDNCNDSDTNGDAFEPTLGGDATAGTLYDQVINGNDYYLQSEWSNGDANCEMEPSGGTITPRFAVPAGPRSAGTALTFDPSLSASTNRVTSETWDFGDGSPTTFHAGRTLTAVSHTYAAAGDYTVRLTLVDNRGDLTTGSEQITVGASPTAAFTYSPSQPQDGGGPVNFDATPSTDSGGAIVSYAWDFGDGSAPATGAIPSHTFPGGGTYLVRLTVTDSLGQVDTATTQVTVTDEPPVAAFTIGTPTPEAGQSVPFDGTSSTDPDGTVTSYAWNFGDGGRAFSATPAHRYAAPGTYTVTMTVTDSGGQHATATQIVTVVAGPTAAFTFSAVQPTEGVPVSFDGTGSTAGGAGGTIGTYSWSFGDGATATGARPAHAYTAPGTFTVRLTVADAAGAASTSTHRLTVADEPPIAAFSIPNGTLLAGQAVGFDAGGSADPDGSIVAYVWNFGDGSAPDTSAAAAATHTYAASGTYSVTLTVTDSGGHSASATRSVTVHAPPQSLFSFSPGLPLAGAATTFDGTGSLNPDTSTSISAYVWNFGDGTPPATGPAPSHTYATAGTYTVTLTVTTALGLSDASSEQVTVADGRPAAAIAVLAPQTAPGRPIAFTGSSYAGPYASTVSYRWSFGDGSSASGRTATHVYRRPGRYLVTLTVVDSTGATTVTYRTVTVASVGPITRVCVQPARAGATLRISIARAGRLIAEGRVMRLHRPGTVAVAVELTAGQRQAVRRGQRVRVRVLVRFVPVRGPAAVRVEVVAFRRASSAAGHLAAVLAG